MALSSSNLLSIFEDKLRYDQKYEPLSSGRNPCHFKYAGREFYAYIKNLSPAYFTNKDVWRAQLTGSSALEEIKASDDKVLFLLIGYDDVNDVYGTWNPYHTKQRIGTSESPSFYSRLSEQNAVGRSTNTFKILELSNEQEVLLFNASLLPNYLADINKWFEDSEYVAMGSKRRPEANEAFRTWNDLNEIKRFFENDKKIINDIKQLIKEGFFVEHKKYFLKYDSIEQYNKAIQELYEDKIIDENQQDLLNRYYKSFVMQSEYDVKEKEEEAFIDWEERNIDENGKLIRITNPDLVEQLRELLYDTEYKNYIGAMNCAVDFYGERFPDMEIADWMKAVKNVVWDIDEAKRISAGQQVATYERKGGKRQMYRIEGREPLNLRRFTLEAVRIFMEAFPDTTYEEIKEIFPDRASGNILFITDKEFAPKNEQQRGRYFHDEGEVFIDCKGTQFYLSNQWKGSEAETTFMPILDEYGIKWEKIANDDASNTPQPRQKKSDEKKSLRTSTRLKIYVTMPDGVTIDGNNVAETYRQVIIRIGPERIRALNLPCLGVNLIATENEIPIAPAASYQSVGGGYYVNTHSSTNDKFERLKTINDELHLGLTIELKDPASL